MCTLCYSAIHSVWLISCHNYNVGSSKPVLLYHLEDGCFKGSVLYELGCYTSVLGEQLHFERSKLPVQSHQKGATVLHPYLGGDHCLAPSLQALETALMDTHKNFV